MYEMNEIRIRPRQLALLLGAVVFLMLLMLRSGSDCAAKNAPSAALRRGASSGVADEHRHGRLPTIYAITPTYARPVQKAELTRLAHTIMLTPNVHWIVVEDALNTSELVRSLLSRTGLTGRSVQLNVKTPDDFKLKAKDPNWSKPRGVEQRNAGLAWVRDRLRNQRPTDAMVYFMDDDNVYSLELFEQIALIGAGKVGVWPVGLVGGLMVERPVLDAGEVIGFNSAWRPERPFPVDMAGFAISADLLMDYPRAVFSYEVQRGYQESEILRQLVVMRDLVPMANNCKDVLVWHTRTETPKLDAETKLRKSGQPASDAGLEV